MIAYLTTATNAALRRKQDVGWEIWDGEMVTGCGMQDVRCGMHCLVRPSRARSKRRYAHRHQEWLLLVLLFAGAHLFGAYLESDEKESPQPAPIPPPRPPVRIIPPEPPLPPAAVRDVLARVRVESPHSYKNLTVFPLSLRSPNALDSIRTLDQAVRRGWLTVREQRRARVPFLTVRNESRHYIFCMAGEIIVGGKQNRILRADVLIPPHSGDIDVPVYCVEQQRWKGTHSDFLETPGIAHRELRMAAAKGASQASIWGEVDSFSRRVGATSATKDYSKVFEDAELRKWLEDVRGRFRRVLGPDRVGAVFVVRNRIIGCELFCDDELFEQLYDKILRSYLMDYAGREPRWATTLDREDIRRALRRTLSAEFAQRATPGVGQLYNIHRGTDGSALVWRNRLVHMILYPDLLVRPLRE